MPIVKKLKCMGHIAAELTAMDVLGCKSYDSEKEPVKAAGQRFQYKVLQMLPGLAESGGEAIRRHVAS